MGLGLELKLGLGFRFRSGLEVSPPRRAARMAW